MRTQAEADRVRSLARRGYNHCAISRATGIPRSTVCRWLNGRTPKFGEERSRGGTCARCGQSGDPFPGLLIFSYAYLLGLFLGDGWIASHRRGVYRLRIFLDRKYPQIVHECEACDRLGIAWRQDGPWNISVARQESVAAMDRHVGPKR